MIDHAAMGSARRQCGVCPNRKNSVVARLLGLLRAALLLCHCAKSKGKEVKNIVCKKTETIPQLHAGTAVAIFETAL